MKLPSVAVVALVAALLAGGAGPRAQAIGQTSAFFTGVDDLPLMPGLVEATEGPLVFDTPSGRIVQVAASGSVSREDVLAFYGAVLPELGWTPTAPTAFRREAEDLVLGFAGETAGGRRSLIVRFEIAPRAFPAGSGTRAP